MSLSKILLEKLLTTQIELVLNSYYDFFKLFLKRIHSDFQESYRLSSSGLIQIPTLRMQSSLRLIRMY